MRLLVSAILVVLSSLVLSVASVVTAPTAAGVAPPGVTALIAPGTGTPDANVVAGYMQNARDYYMTTTPCTVENDCDLVGINYPASFWPLFFRPRWCVPGRCEKWDVSVAEGLANFNSELINLLANTDDEIVLFGYSQGGAIVSDQLRNLVTLDPALKNRLSVVLIGNIDNPVGGPWSLLGFLGHIPIVDVTTGMPTIVDTGIPMTSVHFEYDGVGDSPLYWGNPLAVANAVAGFWYVHGQMLWPNGYNESGLPNGYTPQELADQMNPLLHPENFAYDDYGNPFITIPTRTLPLMIPFLEFGEATGLSWLIEPLVDLVSPALRVLIDTAYDRQANPGIPRYLSILPFNPRLNPVEVAVDFVDAIGEGVQAFLGHLTPTVPEVASTVPEVGVTAPSEVSGLERRSARSAMAAAPDPAERRKPLQPDRARQAADGKALAASRASRGVGPSAEAEVPAGNRRFAAPRDLRGGRDAA